VILIIQLKANFYQII